MKHFIKAKIALLMTAIFFIGLSLPAAAADNSITTGFSGFMINLEYERRINDHWTWYGDIGHDIWSLLSDIDYPTGCGLGFKRYFGDDVMNGGYFGIGAAHINVQGKFLGLLEWDDLDLEVFNYLALTLGYKKAFSSGFTFEGGIQLIYTQAYHQRLVGYSYNISLGHS